MQDHTKTAPALGNNPGVSATLETAITDLGATHAIVEQHIAAMEAQDMGEHCAALAGVLRLLEVTAADLEAAWLGGKP